VTSETDARLQVQTIRLRQLPEASRWQPACNAILSLYRRFGAEDCVTAVWAALRKFRRAVSDVEA
jgi:hypothetical protein